MAGNDEGEWIVVAGASHGAKGAGGVNLDGEFFVGPLLAKGDTGHGLPDLEAEGGPLEVVGELEALPEALAVLLDLFFCEPVEAGAPVGEGGPAAKLDGH